MTRDGQLPLSRRLARVNPRTSMPSAPAVVVGVLAAGLLLLAYAMVTGPLLVARLRGRLTTDGTDETGNRLFSLGRWREPVNALALLYGLVMTVNLARPRGGYDPAGGHWCFLVHRAVLAGHCGGGVRTGCGGHGGGRNRLSCPTHVDPRTQQDP